MQLFPHEQVRKSQDDLIKTIRAGLDEKHNLILHAPTGLGKTVSALVPAVELAIKKNLVVFFLTARHTQHAIAIDTLKKMENRGELKIPTVSLLGKKWLCLQPGVSTLPSREFAEYCRHMVENDKCEYYTNFKHKGKISVEAKKTIEALHKTISDSDDVISESDKCGLCPYEVSLALAKDARVIITDYYYWFSESIRTGLLKRMERTMDQCIIIVDEAHNVPERIKDLASESLSLSTLQYAATEAKKFATQEIVDDLKAVEKIMTDYATGFEHKTLGTFQGKKEQEILFNEKYIAREDFMKKIELIKPYDQLAEACSLVSEDVVEAQQHSSIGRVARFLEAWKQTLDGFTRIMSVDDKNIVLSYRCMDPGVVSRSALNECHSCMLMSGTLIPTSMYKELLALDRVVEREFDNPFPVHNRLNIIVPQTSTKYETRTPEQYKKIAEVLDKIIAQVPGNMLIFFPSYMLKDKISAHFRNNKTIFQEVAGLTKTERADLLNRFRSYKQTGAVLLAAISGSFGEGIDLPGDEVKAVVVVGLPLGKPDLETQSLIEYYDKKFKKGWDYGYVFPAFTKTIQSSGRCIRSETDRGVIVFLDERYAWPKYKQCFPKDWHMQITLLYEKMIKEFFEEKK